GTMFRDYAKFWAGYLKLHTSSPITIEAEADNGVRLALNESLVIDGCTTGSERIAQITGKSNEFVPLRLEYYQDGGVGFLRLFWMWQGHARELIPANAFVHSPADKELVERLRQGKIDVADARY